MPKQRKDRRNHRMFVTRNTEYHFRGDVCIAVRDIRKGSWQLGHQALQRELSGSVRFHGHGDAYPCLRTPRVGDALFFGSGGPDVITSEVHEIRRPPKQLVQEYPF